MNKTTKQASHALAVKILATVYSEYERAMMEAEAGEMIETLVAARTLELENALRDLHNASVTPMHKGRYPFLEQARANAARVLGPATEPVRVDIPGTDWR